MVKLGDELVAAAEQHPTAFLLGHAGVLVLRFCGSGNWLLLVGVWMMTRSEQRNEINLEEDPINSCSHRGACRWMDAVF